MNEVFETEEEEFAEYIELMEWKTQASPEEIARFRTALAAVIFDT
jgi:hypothetical protein